MWSIAGRDNFAGGLDNQMDVTSNSSHDMLVPYAANGGDVQVQPIDRQNVHSGIIR